MEKVQELLGAAVQIKSCRATGWRGGQGGQASPQSPVSFIQRWPTKYHAHSGKFSPLGGLPRLRSRSA